MTSVYEADLHGVEVGGDDVGAVEAEGEEPRHVPALGRGRLLAAGLAPGQYRQRRQLLV